MGPTERSSRILAALVREYIALGRACAFVAPRERGGPGVSLGDGPQHPRAARRRRLRPAAAYLGRADSDRSRLSVLRRPAARGSDAPGAPPRGRGPASPRKRRAAGRLRALRRHRTSSRRRRRHVGLCDSSGARSRPSSIASSSSRSARLACWSSSSPAAVTWSRR